MFKLILFFLFSSNIGFAMKPAPFDDVRYTDPVTKYHVKAKAKGETEVFTDKKKLLWKMETFPGRREIHLSPDGETLVLFGNYHFGDQVQLSREASFAQVFKSGVLQRDVFFYDLFKDSPEELEKKLKLMVKGGGWVGMSELVKNFSVDWKTKLLNFTLYDNSNVSITLNIHQIKHHEEVTISGLKLKFLSFSHENVSSSPDQPFSATVGVYFFEATSGGKTEKVTVFTNAEGRSNSVQLFGTHSLVLLKASGDQKTLTFELK